MKKSFTIFVTLLLSVTFLFGQNSAKAANRNTALRCLKLAENCLAGGDWNNALLQAELGLTYDENISDLIYVKAVAESNLGKTKADVLKLIQNAFDKNEWLSNSQKGARIILADLLCDTGLYDESIEVLDSDPLLFNADAEFIRIKNYYRLGTTQAINNARLKINSARRIYPADSRFPEIFFMFETMILNETEKYGDGYEIPEIVKTISSAYIAKLPDYSGINTNLELMAAFFAEPDNQKRLVRAIDAKNQTSHPLLSIIGLKTGLYSEAQAVELFFDSFTDSISLDMLENLVYLIKSSEVQQQLIEKITDYSGTIIVDENYDLQSEIEIMYEHGRPSYIKYDRNSDGVLDLYSSCDLGAPLFVHYYDNNSEVFYDGYPKVSKVVFNDDDYVFSFIHDDFKYIPYTLKKNVIFEELGIEFYYPVFDGTVSLPEIRTVALKSSSVELPVNDRDGGKVIFSIDNNNLVFANYFENNNKYAVCDFTTGYPYTRYVDYDNDGLFETSEIYDVLTDTEGFDLEYEQALVQNVFTKLLNTDSLYLKKILIDRNGNTINEFSEQYIEYNGKITLWDNDDNGIWDCQYIKYPQKEGEPLVEDTVYYGENGLQTLLVNTVDGIPVKLLAGDSEVMVNAGATANFYWIEESGSEEMENYVCTSLNKGITQGAVDVIQIEAQRVSVVKIGNNIFCKILPESEITEDDKAE